MSIYHFGWTKLPPTPPSPLPRSNCTHLVHTTPRTSPTIGALKLCPRQRQVPTTRCRARRRARSGYRDEEEEEEEEYGHNAEIAMLELYTQSAKDEALVVRAMVDEEEEAEVLIFKGFSSCLSYGTSPDPSKSVVPARAVIKSIDRIKGPFDPSNIQYIEEGLSWETFKIRLQSV
ncbi:uncharacterized protein LOC127810217 [Diospyros lotus]|uniref:uncharacterized protein LOC127810217 n=1 Tax=Diospyros lotus TaxID=55363 RepID=UPI00225B35B0|nr:uncharacterized protein LOC127810217 [Diospyros lotus]